MITTFKFAPPTFAVFDIISSNFHNNRINQSIYHNNLSSSRHQYTHVNTIGNNRINFTKTILNPIKESDGLPHFSSIRDPCSEIFGLLFLNSQSEKYSKASAWEILIGKNHILIANRVTLQVWSMLYRLAMRVCFNNVIDSSIQLVAFADIISVINPASTIRVS